MNTEGKLRFEALISRAEEQSEALAAALKALEADGQPVHQGIINQTEWIVSLTEAAMGLNATLFEGILDETERKRMLELDDALRSQLKALRKVLALPRREG